jgi:DNA repair exonuclease SbcCD ATPase subunit
MRIRSDRVSVTTMYHHLPLPPSGRLRKVIHLSDLHIRNGDRMQSRYDEYKHVFEVALERVKNEADDSTAILITGDIFHNKGKVESSGILLFYEFLTGLSDLACCYIIAGNHDFRQDQPETTDMISALLHGHRINSNICYMNKSGHYMAGDVGFGLVDIKDLLRLGDTRGQVEALPDFPDPMEFPEGVKARVAVFHGTIRSCRLQNYSRAPVGFPEEWFDGYDYGMFGDVHARQVHRHHKKAMVWGYAGAILQNDFGEGIIDSGFLVWDLDNGSVKSVDVRNDWGLLKVREEPDVGWQALVKGAWMPLRELLTMEACPGHLRVRVVWCAHEDRIRDLRSVLGERGTLKFSVDPYTPDRSKTAIEAQAASTEFDLSMVNSPRTWVEYVEQHGDPDVLANAPWKGWLRDPETLCVPPSTLFAEQVALQVAERNSKVMKLVGGLATRREHENSVRASVSLVSLEWSWLLCFGEDNWFDFEKVDGAVVNISGANGHGKSSFFEVVCLALYGETIPTRYCRDMSASTVSMQKPDNTKGRTCVRFVKEGVHYIIRRSYDRTAKDKSKLVIADVSLHKLLEDGSFEQVHSGKSAVDAWVAVNLASIGSFLLCCMLTQNSDQDYFNLRPPDQLALLDSSLHMDSVNAQSEVLRQFSLAYKSIIDTVSAVMGTLEQQEAAFLAEGAGDFERIRSDFKEQRCVIESMQVEHDSIKETWHDLDLKDLEMEDLHHTERLCQLETELRGLRAIPQTQEELQQELGGLVERLRDLGGRTDTPCDWDATDIESHAAARPTPPSPHETEGCGDAETTAMWFEGAVKRYGSELAIPKDSVRPSIGFHEIAKMRETIESCMSKCHEMHGMDADAMMGVLKESERRVEAASALFGVLSDRLVSCRTEWEDAESRLEAHRSLGSNFTRPVKPKLECVEWFDVWGKTSKEAIMERVVVLGKASDAMKAIQDIETRNHPFNDACWACRQQSWKITLDALKSTLSECELTLGKVESTTRGLGELERALQEWDTMKEAGEAWKAYEPYVQTLAELETEVAQKRVAWAAADRAVSDHAAALGASQSAHREVVAFCENSNKWRATLEMLTAQERLHTRFEDATMWQERMRFNSAAAQREAYDAWEGQLREMNRGFWSRRLSEVESDLRTQTKRSEVERSIRRVERVISVRAMYASKKRLKARLMDLHEEEQVLSAAYHKAEAAHRAWLDASSRHKSFRELREDLVRTRYAIEHVHRVFSGFRRWLYDTIILPKLLHETNLVVASLTRADQHHNPLKVMCELSKLSKETDGKDSKLAFSWSFEDGANRPPMSKASGFQRFVFGLGMRISLGRIGATQIYLRQFFLDEGFVACDKAHLGCVPEFMEKMLDFYDAVVTVSHLDEIKECASVHVPIERDDVRGISSIRFGVRPAAEGLLFPQKRRGRPSLNSK